MSEPAQDRWSRWLLERRFGGDADRQEQFMQALYPVRDRVLENAELSAGETVLDVGAGDGLIAFGALEWVGESGRVVFSDISRDLLDHSRALAREMGVLGRCEFVEAPARDLSALGDRSVSVVTTRSVLSTRKRKPPPSASSSACCAPAAGSPSSNPSIASTSTSAQRDF